MVTFGRLGAHLFMGPYRINTLNYYDMHVISITSQKAEYAFLSSLMFIVLDFTQAACVLPLAVSLVHVISMLGGS